MKLVFSHLEVAEALGKTSAEFDQLRPSLENIGFPKPLRGLGQAWSIMEVIRWVNGEGSSMMAAHILAEDEDAELDALESLVAGRH